MHSLDWLLWRRCLGLCGALLALAVGIVVATDEPGSSTGMRVARLVALSPALVVVAQQLTLRASEARGEPRALAALGVTPFRFARGVVLAGWCYGIGAVLLLSQPGADVTSLFPAVAPPASWQPTASGLLDAATGVVVAPSGSIEFSREVVPSAAHRAPALEAALHWFAPVAVLAPVWGATPLSMPARLGGGFCVVLATVVALHARAAGVLPSAVLPAAALPLALQAVVGWGRRSVA